MKNHLLKSALALLAVLVLLGASCSTTKKFYQAFVTDDSGLKKKVLFAPLIDQADLGEAKVGNIRSALVSSLTTDGNIVLVDESNPGVSADKTRSSRHGIVVDPDQIKRADQMGMNVVVTAVISPLDFTSRRAGFWPFRKVKHEAQLAMVVNAFDVVTGTLFLSHLESRTVKAEVEMLEDEEETQSTKPEIDEDEAQKALSKIVQEQAAALSTAVREQPWSGKILSVGAEKVTISAGRDVGLSAGTLLAVYSRGEPIRTADGSFVSPLGIKVGELRVEEVMENQAVAAPVSVGSFAPGQVIRAGG